MEFRVCTNTALTETWPENARKDTPRSWEKPETPERDATVVMRSIGIAIVIVIAQPLLKRGNDWQTYTGT